FAADLAHLGRTEFEQVSPVVGDRALDDAPGRRGDQPHDAECGDALAAPRLTPPPEGLALVDVEVDAVDGTHDPFIREEVGLQPFDLEKTFGHGASSDTFPLPAGGQLG